MSPLQLIFPLLLLFHGTAEAHLLKLFAYVEGPTIHGSAYFAGGTNAAGLAIAISGRDKQPLATLQTDSQGAFSYTPATPGEYRIRADTGEGHLAEWLIRTEAFGQSQSSTPEREISAMATTTAHPAAGPANLAPQQLTALIEQAVARQIGPLREALQRAQDRARLSDVLGGIGFIFGLAGITLWWRGRQGGNKK
jgi:nickel transport protein